MQASTAFVESRIDLGAALISADLLRRSDKRFVIRHTQRWLHERLSTSVIQRAVHDADGGLYQTLAKRDDTTSVVGKCTPTHTHKYTSARTELLLLLLSYAALRC